MFKSVTNGYLPQHAVANTNYPSYNDENGNMRLLSSTAWIQSTYYENQDYQVATDSTYNYYKLIQTAFLTCNYGNSAYSLYFTSNANEVNKDALNDDYAPFRQPEKNKITVSLSGSGIGVSSDFGVNELKFTDRSRKGLPQIVDFEYVYKSYSYAKSNSRVTNIYIHLAPKSTTSFGFFTRRRANFDYVDWGIRSTEWAECFYIKKNVCNGGFTLS